MTDTRRWPASRSSTSPPCILKCQRWQDDPSAYIYFTIQEQN